MKKTTCFLLLLLGLVQAYGQDKKGYVTKTSKYKAAHIYASPNAKAYQKQIVQPVGLDTLDYFKGAYPELVPVEVSELNDAVLLPMEAPQEDIAPEVSPTPVVEVAQPPDTALVYTALVEPADTVSADSLMQLQIHQSGDSLALEVDADSAQVAHLLAQEGQNEKYMEDPAILNGDSLDVQSVAVDTAATNPLVYAMDPLMPDSTMSVVDSLALTEVPETIILDSLSVVSDSVQLATDSLDIDFTAPADSMSKAPAEDLFFEEASADSVFEMEDFNPVAGVPLATAPETVVPPTTEPVITPVTDLGGSREESQLLQEEIKKQKLRNELLALQREAQDPAISRLSEENQYLKERLAFERERQEFYRQLAASRGVREVRDASAAATEDRSGEVEDLRKQLLALEAASAASQVALETSAADEVAGLSSRIEVLNQRVLDLQKTQTDEESPEIVGLKAQISELQKQLEALQSAPVASLPASPVEMEQANIYFKIGSKTLSASGMAQLDDVVGILTRRPALSAKLKGYTDSSGDPDRNVLLSRQRAAAVQEYLVKQGIAPDRLILEYFGADLSYQGLNPAYARRVQIDLGY